MDLYNVNNYSDEQLYEILDMNHPTDRELEAKIIHMMRKYQDTSDEISRKLYSFFDSIYKHFFMTDSDEDEEEPLREGLEGMNVTLSPAINTSTPETKKVGYEPQQIASVQQFDYSPDKLQLNPILKQTIKRVISIDSQYRNIKTSPMTTSFAFDLSEPLRDVVSLKLYSIQIPYSWWTIGTSFGSNFFYLRGSTTGTKDYKIEIAPGNYDQTTLPAAINTAFQDLSNNSASDINFNGEPLITYNSVTAKTTVNLNIQNTYNETYYSLQFSPFSYPSDLVNTTIPGYMGFNNSSYSINSITSNQSYKLTSQINSQLSQDFVLNNSNNYFTVIQYLGYDEFSSYDSRSTVLKQFQVNLLKNGFPFIGNATRQDIITSLNTVISTSGYFTSDSGIQQVNITDISAQNVNYTYFKLSLSLNRNKFKYVPNSKIIALFPNETPIPNQYSTPENPQLITIWQLQPSLYSSCFYFDNSMNEYSRVLSESPSTQSTVTVDTSTNIIMTCSTPGYRTILNDFSMNVQTGNYNLSQFLAAVTNSFSSKNTSIDDYFNMTNTSCFIDTDNYFNLTIDLTKSFSNKNYASIIDGNSFLTTPQQFNITYSIVKNTGPTTTTAAINIYDISYINITIPRLFTGYTIDTSCIMVIQPDGTTYGNGGNKDGESVKVCLPYLTYPTYDSFLTGIQTAFTNTPYTTTVNTQTPFSRSTVSSTIRNNDYVDISLNLNCYYYLTEANYDISFIDYTYDITNTKNTWQPFQINRGYSLSTTTAGYASIIGNSPVSSSQFKQITLNNSNNTFILNSSSEPTDNITVTIDPGSYTIGQLYTKINTALSANPKTYGSHVEQVVRNNQEYSLFSFNINRIFTTQDYVLDFYDPTNFVSCYAGSSGVQNTTWDTTIGWILGFRDYTQYFLTKANQTYNNGNRTNPYYYLNSITGKYIFTSTYDPSSNLLLDSSIQLTGDTALNTNLYNYFLISLDDYIQNHLNDGLVTITRSQTSIELPDYSYSTTQQCDPATGEPVNRSSQQTNSDNVTNAQLYAINQSAVSQQNPDKQYSPGPFIKDLFGIIPVKPPGKTGDYYTEFGGSLQNQERLYFGPVNIRKMSVQLLTDRGTVLDLNGSNWSFSFICEQLYRASST